MTIESQDTKFFVNASEIFRKIKTLSEEIKSHQRSVSHLRRDIIKSGK
jgi:hypothetical protein